ncbi:MAG: LysR family hydrogen peroxide-inducible transcriptional activator [Pseudohongiellaceae bacterium]|jgi:LysR family hydrogen peroxide-inducible transcriptional activator
MNLKDLKYFLAIAELEHFGHAAQQCNVSHPTLSG